ncbi:kinase-like domain-containing protein [Mycena floridula]|nr:kinase-like domain-containing protein [Mycena floridula]
MPPPQLQILRPNPPCFDDFIEQVSLGERDGLLDVKRNLRVLLDNYYRIRLKTMATTRDFIVQVAQSLPHWQLPSTVERLTALLSKMGQDEIVHVCLDNQGAASTIPRVNLIVIILPRCVEVCELDSYQTSIHLKIESTFGDLSQSWAKALMELLQMEIKLSHNAAIPGVDEKYRAKCIRYLHWISKKYDSVLPPSFVIHNLVKQGDRPLSGGSFADVYRGTVGEMQVCLKVLRHFTACPEKTAKLAKQFCGEALAWRQLEHPNILPFLGVNFDLFSPTFCLVSPWMSQGNLKEYLERHPICNRSKAILEISEAINYLHNQDPPVVHGNIRCVAVHLSELLISANSTLQANILVTDDIRCCLADFGLTRLAESQTNTNSTGGIPGSVRWMAPELLLNSEPKSYACKPTRDIYAFACTVYEIYRGKSPFHNQNIDATILLKVSHGERPPRPATISDGLWNLVEGCWAQDPQDRPVSSEILSALKREIGMFQGTSPTRARSVQTAPASAATKLNPKALTFVLSAQQPFVDSPPSSLSSLSRKLNHEADVFKPGIPLRSSTLPTKDLTAIPNKDLGAVQSVSGRSLNVDAAAFVPGRLPPVTHISGRQGVSLLRHHAPVFKPARSETLPTPSSASKTALRVGAGLFVPRHSQSRNKSPLTSDVASKLRSKTLNANAPLFQPLIGVSSRMDQEEPDLSSDSPSDSPPDSPSAAQTPLSASDSAEPWVLGKKENLGQWSENDILRLSWTEKSLGD